MNLNRIKIDQKITKGQIDKNIYGHFAEHLGRCIYEGIWVGPDSGIPNVEGYRKDVIEALKKLEIPVLRWPGGCFADEYHWRDGIGPYENRKRMVNTHWGGVVENNHFGTHEFMRFCELIETEPYICGNVGSGTVQEMSEWVEYMTFDGESPMAKEREANGKEAPWPLTYFGVGNENWGCGGNMRAEYYADLYRRYATYVRNYGENRIKKIAGGPNVDDYHWTEVCMKNIPKQLMWGLSLHNYTFTRCWEDKGEALGFMEKEWHEVMANTLRMDELITKHSNIMDVYDPGKSIALIVDEWGTWYNVEPGTNPGFLYQQNSIRDALVAAVNFNIFHNHCDRVKMANIAQMINVLQAVILTDKEKMILTPTYHVFSMYSVHKDAQHIHLELDTEIIVCDGVKIPAISATASVNVAGVTHLSICNLDPAKAQTISCAMADLKADAKIAGSIITGDARDAHNSFEKPEAVTPSGFSAFKAGEGSLSIELPPMSVVTLSIAH